VGALPPFTKFMAITISSPTCRGIPTPSGIFNSTISPAIEDMYINVAASSVHPPDDRVRRAPGGSP
jgi:hypothetical protein